MAKKKALLGLNTLIVTGTLLTTVACSKMEIGDKTLSKGQDVLKDVASGLRGQGSSSVLPIVKEFQDALSSKDFQYEGTGSGDGLKVGTGAIADKDFGLTSSLKRPLAGQQADHWTENRVRTITFAIDAIGIALHLPKELSNKLNANNRPIIDAKELVKLYDNDTKNDDVTWSQLLENKEADNFNETIFPLGRTGGKLASGTADGFFNNLTVASGLNEESLDVNHEKLGANHQTAEANSQAKQVLEDHINSLTYLSLGYALANESEKLTVATIHTFNNQMWVPKLENVSSKTYGWRRPFNAIYSINNKKAVTFAQFLLTENVQNLIKSLDFVPLDINDHDVIEQSKNYALLSDTDLHLDITQGKLGLLE